MKFKYSSVLFILFTILTVPAFSQDSDTENENASDNKELVFLKDSLNALYKRYYSLQKSQDSIMNMQKEVTQLKVNYDKFNEILASNNQAIKSLTEKELFTMKTQFEQQKNKIINTADFVSSANVSLNAIKQLDATTDYLNQITKLNNPENTDLGFSLADQIEALIEQKIINGKNKINGIKSGKFLGFVNEIIKSPITESLTSAVPVVSSIKSVVDLVINTAVNGNDISIEEVNDLKRSLKVYVDHYEGLAKAELEFHQSLTNLGIRKNGLILLLKQYSEERVETLKPGSITDADKKINMTEFINKHYRKDAVVQQVNAIIAESPDDYYTLSNDNRFFYPNYALNQAKFVRDEIQSLASEYLTIFNSYQTSLEAVLSKSKGIGDKNKIDQKIKDLEEKLGDVQSSFEESLNLTQLNDKFTTLMHY